MNNVFSFFSYDDAAVVLLYNRALPREGAVFSPMILLLLYCCTAVHIRYSTVFCFFSYDATAAAFFARVYHTSYVFISVFHPPSPVEYTC